MSEWAPKRFWKTTETTEVENGFGVLLDGRPVRTPAKAELYVPSRSLAQQIATEFAAQEDRINPMTMPYTRTANAAIDKVSVQHAEVADMLAAYGDSDLLCYRADAPDELVMRQSEQWDPLLAWAEQSLGAKLESRTGVMHSPQSQDALTTLRTRVHAMSDFELAAFHDLVSISGSLIIGFAAALSHRPIDELWATSRLDENWQQEQWGEDEEAQDMENYKKAAFLHAHTFLHMIYA
jgi:chaperone required for assembly of F1-ATPase